MQFSNKTCWTCLDQNPKGKELSPRLTQNFHGPIVFDAGGHLLRATAGGFRMGMRHAG